MSRGRLVAGHVYRPVGGLEAGPQELAPGEWARAREALQRAGGGRVARDTDGALAVYDGQGRRLFEVYDRDPVDPGPEPDPEHTASGMFCAP